MRLSSSKLKRAKFDGAYIFATVFASIGGLILLSSYASSKPINTYNLGSYNLTDYVTSQPDVYQLGLNGKLNYCISPLQDASTTSVSLVSGNTQQPLILNSVSGDTACFKTVVDHEKALVKIQPTPGASVTISAN